MKVHSVYLGDVYLKCFKSERDASILCDGLRIFLTISDMDVGLVKTKEEEI